jgi:hypothetical protein
MAKVPTKVQILRGFTDEPRPQDGQSFTDGALARGGVIGLGFVPQIQADLTQPAGALDAQYVTFTVTGANDVAVDHNLKRVPRRFAVVHKSAAVDVFRGVAPWTDSRVFFRASVAAQVVTVELA